MMDRILALDPANRTGWAWWDGEGKPTHGVWDLSGPRDDHPGNRLVRLHNCLTAFFCETELATLIAYEDSHYGSHNYDHVAFHGEARGIVKAWAATHEVPLLAVNPSSLKLFATGYGRATKPQMVRAAERQFGVQVTDDEADALFILEYAKQRHRLVKPKKAKGKRQGKKKDRRLF